MAELCPLKVWAIVASWPIFGRKLDILDIFFEIWTSNLLCPSFTLIVRVKLNQKSIGPKSTTLIPKKTIKMAKSQNAILAKCQSPKSLLLLHFFMKVSETFSIDINMDFANSLVREFLIQASKKILSPKSVFDPFFAPMPQMDSIVCMDPKPP